MTSSVWAVGTNGEIFLVEGRNMTLVQGKMKHVSAGESGVWGVSQGGHAYFRKGVTPFNPKGTDWIKVSGQNFRQVDSGPYGVVYGVSKNGAVRCREKITDDEPKGLYRSAFLQVQ